MAFVPVKGRVREESRLWVADGVLIAENDAHSVVGVVADIEVLKHVLVEVDL